jgi:HEAT repeat protein
MLSGIEHVPSDADWRQLGPGALPVLIDLYADTGEPGFVRLRAVGATGAFATAATRTFLLAVAHADRQSDLFVREAVTALARAFGAGATQDLVHFLGHTSPIVREATANALGRVGAQGATSALRSRLAIERDGAVRTAIERALR